MVWIYMYVCAQSLSCVWLCGPMDCSPYAPLSMGFPRQEQEWTDISSSMGSSWPRDRTSISCIDRQILYHWATWKAQVLGWGCLFAHLPTNPLDTEFLMSFLNREHFTYAVTAYSCVSPLGMDTILKFCFIFWLHHIVCGILVPWPGVEPLLPALEFQSLNGWTGRGVLEEDS